MKDRKNYTYKMRYLEEIILSGRIPDIGELAEMYRMSQDKNPIIRWTLAKALVNRYTAESEEILRNMADDKNRLVRINAIDSLCIGREKETLELLKERMKRNYSKMESGYAVYSYFDVYVNRYGYNRESMRRYLEEVKELYKQEDRAWVSACYEVNRYLAGEKDSLDQLFAFFKEQNKEDYSVQRSTGNAIRGIINIFNKDIVRKKLKEVESESAKRIIKEIEDGKIQPKVLILSEENAGMSQLLEYLGKCEEGEKLDIMFDSAGTRPKEKINEALIKLLEQKEDYDITVYQYPKPVMKMYRYDFIIPVGIKLNVDDYPFQKILPLFEEGKEHVLDLEGAEQMMEKVRLCIKMES